MADVETWLAITAILVGLVLVFLEVWNPGFFIAIPGTVLAVLGFVGLVAPHLLFGAAGWVLVPGVALLATVGTLWAYKRWAPAGDAPITLTKDSLPGREGRVTKAIPGGDATGHIRVSGTNWSARATEPVPVGATVRVLEVDGIHAVVAPVASAEGAPDADAPQGSHTTDGPGGSGP